MQIQFIITNQAKLFATDCKYFISNITVPDTEELNYDPGERRQP